MDKLRLDRLKQKAWSMIDSKEYEQALGLFNECVSADPDNLTHLVEKGVALYKMKRVEEAIATFDQVLARSPQQILAYNNKARALIDLGREQEAMLCYRTVLSFAPDHARTWFRTAQLMQRMQVFEKALACYDEAIRLDPKDAETWHGRGTLALECGDPIAAIADFEQAIELQHKYFEAMRDRVRALMDSGRLGDAKTAINELMRLKPKNTEVELIYGELLLALKDHQGALGSFESIIGREKDCAAAWDGKGRALRALGQEERGLLNCGTAAMIKQHYDEALRLFDSAIAANPNYAEAWSNKGVLLAKMKRHTDAVDAYQRSLAIAPAAVPVMNNLALLLYNDLGRKEEGLKWFRESIRYEPQRWFQLPSEIRTAIDALNTKGSAQKSR